MSARQGSRTGGASAGGGGAVSSVAGKTGVVTLVAADVSGVETPTGAQTKADAAQATAQASSAQRTSNLSDLASASTARTNLGLGGSATLAVGTTTGTVAAGDDSRITGAAQKASNLSDLASASTARTNLGLGAAALLAAVTDTTTIPLTDGTVAAAGSQALGSPRDHVHGRYLWTPSDNNLLAATCDPALLSTTTNTGSTGQLNLCRFHVPYQISVTNLVWYIGSAGATLTSGQCFAALYNAAGTLIGVTADQSVAWVTGNTIKTMPLVGGPFTCPAGDYYWGYWFVGTTGPGPLRQSLLTAGQLVLNVGLSAPNLRTATANTGLTTTAPGTLGSQTSSALFWWGALS